VSDADDVPWWVGATTDCTGNGDGSDMEGKEGEGEEKSGA
jgi:hypothetical protein